jgi:alpha-mannosidase
MKTKNLLETILAVILGCALSDMPASAGEETAKHKVEEVVVVFKTHFDIGFTDLASNVVKRYRTDMIDGALRVIDQNRNLPPDRQFVWTVPGWPMSKMVEDWPGQTKERRERIISAVRDGRLVWHALPYTTHTESLELEDLVRGMNFSSALSRQFGQPLARDAKMTDVPSHCWVLPTLLKNAGVEFLHLGCNSASSSPQLPPLFWWEGPDGSRVLTMYSGGDYGTGLVAPADWPYHTWLALIHTGDNHGPPKPEEVDQLFKEAARKLPGVKLRLGRLSDFSDAILKEKADIPVVRGDMPDTWIHGIMSMPVESKTARNIRPEIGVVETLGTLAKVWGLDKPASDDHAVATAYEKSLMFGEHTWGYNMMLLPPLYGKAWEAEWAKGTYAKLERSFVEKGQHVRDAAAAVEPALHQDLSLLAKAVKADGERFVVFNPLPWKRSQVPVCVDAGKVRADALRDVETGRVFPVERDGSRIRFLADDVPSQGFRTYVPAAAGVPPVGMLAVDPAGRSMENDVLKISLDPARGGMVSIIDKSTGRELVDSSKYVAGQYLHERFDWDDDEAYLAAYCKIRPDWAATFGKPKLPPSSQTKYRADSPVNMKAEVRQGAVSATVTMMAEAGRDLAHAVTLQFTLYRGKVSYVDMQWAVNGKPADPWPEAGWICLPLKIDQPQFRLGRVGSIMDPSKDIVRGANHDIFCLSSGLTVAGRGGEGVGVVPLDSPLVSLGYPGIYRYVKEWKDREPKIFINLFNNIWGTNFQQWIGGSWSSRVRIWALPGGGNAAGDLIARGWEARTPCLTGFADGIAGNLPPTGHGIELSRDGILVTAFGANPDGKGLVLRLWEQAGVSGKVTVRLPAGMKASRITAVNLRGESMGKSEPLEGDGFDADLKAFAPASFVLE